jgi:hypothetical protein
LLEGIGAIKPDKKKNHDAYQDSVTAPLSRQYDEEVAAQEDPPDDDEDNLPNDTPENLQIVLSAIEKVVMLHIKSQLVTEAQFSSVRLSVQFVQAHSVVKRGSGRLKYRWRQ